MDNIILRAKRLASQVKFLDTKEEKTRYIQALVQAQLWAKKVK